MPFAERLKHGLDMQDSLRLIMENTLGRIGIAAKSGEWPPHYWFSRLQLAAQAIASVITAGVAFILADDEQWGADDEMLGRRRIPFLEHDGVYWGAPADDVQAIAELERLRRTGAEAIVFAWPAFWWLEHYREFAQHLADHYPRIISDGNVVIFVSTPKA